MKGSSGAGGTALFIIALLVVSWGELPREAVDPIAAVAVAFVGLFFLCRSIESLKGENRG